MNVNAKPLSLSKGAFDLAMVEAEKKVLPLLRDDDLTVDRLVAAKEGMSVSQARKILAKLVKEEKLIRVQCRTKEGARPVAYRVPMTLKQAGKA